MTNIQAIDLLKGLEQSLDDYCELNDEGKTAFRMAITALEVFGISEQLPSAQPDVPDINIGDMISRQAAISHVDDVPYIKDHPNEGLLWKAWIESLPSAQPEVIRCKDCRNNHWCNIQEAAMAGDNFFCGAAERRTDEQ